MPSAPQHVRWTDHAYVKANTRSALPAPISSGQSSTAMTRGRRTPEQLSGASRMGPGSSSTTILTGTTRRRRGSSPSGDAGSLIAMKIDGHYDPEADIAWLRFEGYDPATVVAEEITTGLR